MTEKDILTAAKTWHVAALASSQLHAEVLGGAEERDIKAGKAAETGVDFQQGAEVEDAEVALAEAQAEAEAQAGLRPHAADIEGAPASRLASKPMQLLLFR